MTLAERLQAELKNAMRNRDELRRDTLRMALSAAHNAEVAVRRPLTDDEVLTILAKEVKSRHESIEAFEGGGRMDLADKEREEAAILAEFMPAPLGEDELLGLVRDAIAEAGATTPRDLGKVMALLAPRTRGRADGKLVSAAVARELAQAPTRATPPSPAVAPSLGTPPSPAAAQSPGTALAPAAAQSTSTSTAPTATDARRS